MKRLALLMALVIAGTASGSVAAPDVPTAVGDLTASLNTFYHGSKKTGGLGYSITQTQQTLAYKALVALGGVWPPVVTPPPPPPVQTTNCFKSPGACGFPDPAYGNVGVPAGTTLTNSGGFSTSSPGQVINALNVSGQIICNQPNVTIENSHITYQGGLFNEAIQIQGGCTGLKLLHSTCNGAGSSGSSAMEDCVFNGFEHYNGAQGPTLDSDYIYNASDPVEYGGTVTNSYLIANGIISGAHYEDIYVGDGTVVADHDTLLNPNEQTATVFGDVCGGCGTQPGDNNITITNSLLAGGGFLVYTNSGARSIGSSETNISNNRFSTGYFSGGGSFGTFSWTFCPSDSPSQVAYANNVWDSTGAAVACTSQHV